MATFIGKGELEAYSCCINLEQPIQVADVAQLLLLPPEYADTIIVVKHNTVLSLDEVICNQDEVMLFLSLMGG